MRSSSRPVAITVTRISPRAMLLVDHGAEDDVRVLVRRLLDQRRGLVDLVQRQVGAAGDVDQHAARAVDRDVLEQRARDRRAARRPRRGSRPRPTPVPISARPISFMIVRTSAKSRLMRPWTVIRSEMPRTALSSTSSACGTRPSSAVSLPASASSRWFGIVISVSTTRCSSSSPRSAWRCALPALEEERLGHDADRERAELARDLRDRPAPRRCRCRRPCRR